MDYKNERCLLFEEREAILINRRKILCKIEALKSLFESTGKKLIEIDSEIEKLNNKKI